MTDKKKLKNLLWLISICGMLKVYAGESPPTPDLVNLVDAARPQYAGLPMSLDEATLKGLKETLENAGERMGEKAAAHLAVAAQNVGQKAAKEVGDATKIAAQELREAIQKGRFQVPVTHSFDISASTICKGIGGVLLAKSIWNELYEDTTLTNNTKKSFFQENKNIIGGVLGTLLLFNQQILNLFGFTTQS